MLPVNSCIYTHRILISVHRRHRLHCHTGGACNVCHSAPPISTFNHNAKLRNYRNVWKSDSSGTVVLPAPLNVTFSFIVSREAQLAWCAPKPPSRPGTPLSASPESVLTSLAGGQKLRAVGWISSKTHSSDGKSVRGPPLDTGWTCETTGGTWKQPEVEGEKTVFRHAEQRWLRALKVRNLSLV